MTTRKCQCAACGNWFVGTEAFDAHRFGGMNDRRCKPFNEMIYAGWRIGRNGGLRQPTKRRRT